VRSQFPATGQTQAYRATQKVGDGPDLGDANLGFGNPLPHYMLWRGAARRQIVVNLGWQQRIFYTYPPDFVLDLTTISSRGITAM
jgi:hypothetical protein